MFILVSLVIQGQFPALATPTPEVVAASSNAVRESDAAAMVRIEAYLSGITTLTASFDQVNADGSLAQGKFYLKRPGKMRWQYAPPTPVLLVSDGKVLVYYDADLDQVNYIGLEETLAAFLTQRTIRFNSDAVMLTDFMHEAGVLRATVVLRKKPTEGSLTLEFSDAPLAIRHMTVVDAAGNRTQVHLQDARYGEALPDKLFLFEDARGSQRRGR